MCSDSAREGGADLSIQRILYKIYNFDSAREGGADLSIMKAYENKEVSCLRPRGRGGFKLLPISAVMEPTSTPPARAGRI